MNLLFCALAHKKAKRGAAPEPSSGVPRVGSDRPVTRMFKESSRLK